jgi:hypothetical protein
LGGGGGMTQKEQKEVCVRACVQPCISFTRLMNPLARLLGGVCVDVRARMGDDVTNTSSASNACHSCPPPLLPYPAPSPFTPPHSCTHDAHAHGRRPCTPHPTPPHPTPPHPTPPHPNPTLFLHTHAGAGGLQERSLQLPGGHLHWGGGARHPAGVYVCVCGGVLGGNCLCMAPGAASTASDVDS